MKAEFRKKAINRLHILQGQLRGLERMVKSGKYCLDVLTQTAAVQKSLAGFNQLIMENHLRQHSFPQLRSHEDEKVLKELMKIYKISNPTV